MVATQTDDIATATTAYNAAVENIESVNAILEAIGALTVAAGATLAPAPTVAVPTTCAASTGQL